ncbi:hypothetical protein ACN47E_004835 [Coniothyrium glycines]
MNKSSIFEILPYDVRTIVYDYLEPEGLPPLAKGFQLSTSGFLLSCRHAKTDFDDIAITRVTTFLHNLKATFEQATNLICDISFPTSPAELRHVSVTLPFTALLNFRPGTVSGWKREVLEGLHPLFAASFDKVRIHFAGTENMPPSDTIRDRGQAEVRMHRVLRDVGHMIEHVNTERGSSGYTVDMIFPYTYRAGVKSKPYQCSVVRAKRICLSWDLRRDAEDTSADMLTLNGTRHGMLVHNQELVAQDVGRPMFYQLRDQNRLIGEMGIESSTRWQSENYPNLNRVLNTVSTHDMYCHSDGPGKDLGFGLKGMQEEAYVEQEREISDMIFDT